MNKTNDIKENFAALLRDSLRQRFGRIPSAAIVAREFNLRAYDTPPISQESARRWIRGVSLPEEQRLRVLVNWLNLDFNAALRPGRNLNGHGAHANGINGALNGDHSTPTIRPLNLNNTPQLSAGLGDLISHLNADQKQMLESFMKVAFKNSSPTL